MSHHRRYINTSYTSLLIHLLKECIMSIHTVNVRACSPQRPRFNLLTFLVTLNTSYRHRHHMKALNDSQLHDIGVTRADIAAEADRSLWDAPRHWCA
jgi:uncharacterized protein YjiS (DUF1127 family)